MANYALVYNTTKYKPHDGNRDTKEEHSNTKCGYKKYRNKLTKSQASEILKKNIIQESYDKWSEEV